MTDFGTTHPFLHYTLSPPNPFLYAEFGLFYTADKHLEVLHSGTVCQPLTAAYNSQSIMDEYYLNAERSSQVHSAIDRDAAWYRLLCQE